MEYHPPLTRFENTIELQLFNLPKDILDRQAKDFPNSRIVFSENLFCGFLEGEALSNFFISIKQNKETVAMYAGFIQDDCSFQTSIIY